MSISPTYAHFSLTEGLWQRAWHSDHPRSLASICAKIACIVFPIIITIAAAEAVVWIGYKVTQFSQEKKAVVPREIAPPPPDPARKAVYKAYLYQDWDPMMDNQFPTSVFPCLVGAELIANHFYEFECKITAAAAEDDTEVPDERAFASAELSAIQENFNGTGSIAHRLAFEELPGFLEGGGAQLDNIKANWADFLEKRGLEFGATTQENAEALILRVQKIVDHLFQNTPQKRMMALINCTTEKSFVAISKDDKIIVLDPTLPKMILIEGKENARKFLLDKLVHYVKAYGTYVVPSYALGQSAYHYEGSQ